MPFADLREFLALLDAEGELQRVKTEVEQEYEIGAICRTVLDAGGPALLFEQIKGTNMPMAVNFFSTRKRYALGLETTVNNLHADWVRRTAEPIPPVLVKSGPCKENILLGDAVDLWQLPVPIWNELDGGHYITLPCHITRNPETGIRNAGMYRGMVHGRNKLGVLAVPSRHLAMHRAKTSGPFPVAIAIGVDPAITIATVASFPYGVDELAMAGALRGQAVELVPCETIPLEVPATAELVIEGEIYPGELIAEGPFGEFTGYYGVQRQRPVITVKAITHRNNPIFAGCYVGRPPGGSSPMTAVPIEAEIRRWVSLPGLLGLCCTEGGANFNLIAQIDKTFEGHAKMIALAILGTWGARFIKTLILVDKDVDPFDWRQVEWALATRMQPHRDIEVLHDLPGVSLDPSLPEDEKATGRSRSSKVIIDATRYNFDEYEIPCQPHPEALARVRSRWLEYGISI